jgi:hypothetical protein
VHNFPPRLLIQVYKYILSHGCESREEESGVEGTMGGSSAFAGMKRVNVNKTEGEFPPPPLFHNNKLLDNTTKRVTDCAQPSRVEQYCLSVKPCLNDSLRLSRSCSERDRIRWTVQRKSILPRYIFPSKHTLFRCKPSHYHIFIFCFPRLQMASCCPH